jgi:hypothetical protein
MLILVRYLNCCYFLIMFDHLSYLNFLKIIIYFVMI